MDIYQAAVNSFDTLPLAAVVADQFFCIHGGISENIKTVDDVRAVNRFCEPPQKVSWLGVMVFFSGSGFISILCEVFWKIGFVGEKGRKSLWEAHLI